jgi:hypothetical protein
VTSRVRILGIPPNRERRRAARIGQLRIHLPSVLDAVADPRPPFLTIGQHGPLLTFNPAKKQALAMLADATRGGDPVEIRKTARRASSIADLDVNYLERPAVPKKRTKNVRDDRAMLGNIIQPSSGRRK